MKHTLLLPLLAAFVVILANGSSAGQTFFTSDLLPGSDSLKSMDRLDIAIAPADSSTMDSTSSYFTCSMHPEMQSDKPGKCPKCGMDLVKVEKGKPQNQESMKMKPMCPMMNGMSDSNMNHSEGGHESGMGMMVMMGIGMGAVMLGMMTALIVTRDVH